MADRVPAEPIRQRLLELVDLGNSIEEISRALNVDRGVIHPIANAERVTVKADVANAILALPLGYVGNHELSGPSTRRLQALAAIGHSQATIGKVSGLKRDSIQGIQAGAWRRVLTPDAEAIRRAYTELKDQPGSSRRTRDGARLQQWPPPQAWTDHDLDDPEASTTARVSKRWFSSGQALTLGQTLRDARLAHDYTRDELAAKLGTSVATLRAWENDRYPPTRLKRDKLKTLLGWTMPEEGGHG